MGLTFYRVMIECGAVSKRDGGAFASNCCGAAPTQEQMAAYFRDYGTDKYSFADGAFHLVAESEDDAVSCGDAVRFEIVFDALGGGYGGPVTAGRACLDDEGLDRLIDALCLFRKVRAPSRRRREEGRHGVSDG